MRGFFFLLITVFSTAGALGIGYYYLGDHPLEAVKGLGIFVESVTPTPFRLPNSEKETLAFGDITEPSVSPIISLAHMNEQIITGIPTEKLQIPTPTLFATPTLSPSVVPSPTKTPTAVPTAKPTVMPTIKPTSKPTSMPTTVPIVLPTPTRAPSVASPVNPSYGLNADTVFKLVNDYRSVHGLSPFQRDATTCSVAQKRAPQVYDEIFVTYTMHAGLKAMKLPYWITETIINNSTEADAVDWWIDDLPHRQILLGNYTYSCAACYGYSCSQVYTNFIPK